MVAVTAERRRRRNPVDLAATTTPDLSTPVTVLNVGGFVDTRTASAPANEAPAVQQRQQQRRRRRAHQPDGGGDGGGGGGGDSATTPRYGCC